MYTSPRKVIVRLDHLSERLCVKYAATNHEISTAVFGRTAAQHLNQYRIFMEHGETELAQSSLIKAQETAKGGTCGVLKSAESETKDDSDKGGKTEESSGKKMMNCPFCKARVYDDPCAKVLSCWDCKASVVNGKVRSQGDGGSKARKEHQAAEQLEQLGRQVDEVFSEQNHVAESVTSEPVKQTSPKQLQTSSV